MSFEDRRSPDYHPQYMREPSIRPSNHQRGEPWFWLNPWSWFRYWCDPHEDDSPDIAKPGEWNKP